MRLFLTIKLAKKLLKLFISDFLSRFNIASQHASQHARGFFRSQVHPVSNMVVELWILKEIKTVVTTPLHPQ